MQKKEWYKSKTIWSAVALLGIGIARYYNIELPYDAIVTFLGGLGLYGIRDAIDKN